MMLMHPMVFPSFQLSRKSLYPPGLLKRIPSVLADSQAIRESNMSYCNWRQYWYFKRPFDTSHEASRIVYFDFNGREEIMASYHEEEVNAVFKFSVVRVLVVNFSFWYHTFSFIINRTRVKNGKQMIGWEEMKSYKNAWVQVRVGIISLYLILVSTALFL